MKIRTRYVNYLIFFITSMLCIFLSFDMLKDFFNNGFVDVNKVTDALIGISLFLLGALFINAVSFLVDGISKER